MNSVQVNQTRSTGAPLRYNPNNFYNQNLKLASESTFKPQGKLVARLGWLGILIVFVLFSIVLAGLIVGILYATGYLGDRAAATVDSTGEGAGTATTSGSMISGIMPTGSTTMFTTPACAAPGAVYCVDYGRCLTPNQTCNYIRECPDGSDEKDCQNTCPPGQSQLYFECQPGFCIPKSFVCDGLADCSNGLDEGDCVTCEESTEFKCSKDKSCIPQSAVCDGKADCSDSADEGQCYTGRSPSQVDQVTFKGVQGHYLCTDDWKAGWNDLACQAAGYSGSASVRQETTPGGANLFLKVRAGTTSSSGDFINNMDQVSACANNRIIVVTCRNKACGVRSQNIDNVGPYILNGQEAEPGAWPWHVLVGVENDICGGSIINRNWILTAAHCFRNQRLSTLYVGSVYTPWSREDTHRKTYTIQQRILHPNFNGEASSLGDVALLKVTPPMQFNDYIQPICIADKNLDLKQFKVCVVTGFGALFDSAKGLPMPSRLRQARQVILQSDSELEAKGVIGKGEVFDDFNIATATEEFGPNFCSGDSGGPLVCSTHQDTWIQVGIVSNSPSGCHSYSIYTNVPYYYDWIVTTIADT